MKNTIKIITLVVVIGFSITACNTGSDTDGYSNHGAFQENYYGTWFMDKAIFGLDHDRTITITNNRFEMQASNGKSYYLKFDIESWDAVTTMTGTMSPPSAGYPTTHDMLVDYPYGFTLTIKSGTLENPGVDGSSAGNPGSSLTIYMHKIESKFIWWWSTGTVVGLYIKQ